MNTPSEDHNETNAPLPLFGSWRNAYLAVVVVFFLEVGFFCFMGRYFL